MKKAIAIVLVLMMAFSYAVVSSAAGDEVQASGDYDGFISSHFDSILADDVPLGGGGQAFAYMQQNGYLVEVKANVITLKGWAVCDTEIQQIGYSIDEGTPVFKEDYKVETEQAIRDYGANNGADYATRFIIPIDVSALTGRKTISLVLKNPDGVFKVKTLLDNDFEFEFIQEGTMDSEPEPTPDSGEPAEPVEPLIVRFNDIDVVDEFFMYSGNNSHVADIGFDEEKNCAVISCMGGPDPNVLLPFLEVARDDTLDFFDGDISTSDYKSLLIIGRFDYDTIMEDDKDVGGTFYFATDEYAGFNEGKNLQYYYEKGDGLQYVILDFANHKQWKGSVADCRFDFFMTTDNDCEYELYLLAFFQDAAKAEEFVAAYKENGDSILPTPEPTPEPTATPEATEAPDVSEAPEEEATAVPEETAAPEATDKPSGSKKGCGGFIAAAPVCAVMIASAFVLRKKKD